jgi:regulator of sigma E protease
MNGPGLTIVATLVVIGVLVFVHELGHFVAAKLAGIYVHRFSLGLGSPIRWLTFHRGETEYSVSWLPLGGYVKMASRLEDPASMSLEGGPAVSDVPPDRVFEAKPVGVRMAVILAGVVMNGLFAWLLFSALVYAKGIPVVPITTIGSVDAAALPAGARSLGTLGRGDRIVAIGGVPVGSWQGVQERWLATAGDSVRVDLAGGKPPVWLAIPQGSPDRLRALRAVRPLLAPVVAETVPDRPGAKAGLAVGDTIVSFDGQPIEEWRDMVSQIEGKANQPVDIVVGRASGRATLHAVPAAEEVTDSVTGAKRTIGRLGIFGPLFPDARERVGLLASLAEGGRRTGVVATDIIGVLKGMFSGRVSTRELGGPIAIGMAAGQSARRGLEDFLIFMAAISVNLGILNLLPIPVLDGGQFLFLLAEAVTRRPVTGRVREWLTMVGLVAVLLLMVLAFSNDIRRLLGI